MPRLAFLLRPGWLALVWSVAFTYLCFTKLSRRKAGQECQTSREKSSRSGIPRHPAGSAGFYHSRDLSAPPRSGAG